MTRRTGGELLALTLRKAGVDTVFTLHGGHLDAFLQAAGACGLRLIDTRHEQAAGHAADGWARVTGRTGVALVTAGPGITNCITAVTNAYLDAIPVVVIAGAAPLRDAETLPLQGDIDAVAMLTPVTKWAHRITHTERIPDLVDQGLRVARRGRPGPVFLEIPIDVLFAPVEAEVTVPKVAVVEPPAPAARAVTQAIEWLRSAERPAILAGGGVLFSGAFPAVRELAERTSMPVFTNSKSRGTLDTDHALHGGGFANLAHAGAADVVLILGARLGRDTGGRRGGVIPGAAKVIQVDIEAEEIGRNRAIELGIVADCRHATEALLGAAGDRWPPRTGWLASVRDAASAHRRYEADAAGDGVIHPYRLAKELASVLPPDAIVCADGGETAHWMAMVAHTSQPGRWLGHGYLGCLGTGLPFAIAAKAAEPDTTVACIVGDGSVGFNFTEFDTLARHGLAVLTVVNNDQQWGMSAHGQDLIFGPGHNVVTHLGATRYDEAAAGFGCHGEFVERARDLRPALERALASGKPACVNVLTDPTVVSPHTIAAIGQSALAPSSDTTSTDTVVMPYYDNLELPRR